MCLAPILASMASPIDYIAIKIYFQPSLGYELSLGTSFVKVDLQVAENGCSRQTNRQTDAKKII